MRCPRFIWGLPLFSQLGQRPWGIPFEPGGGKFPFKAIAGGNGATKTAATSMRNLEDAG